MVEGYLLRILQVGNGAGDLEDMDVGPWLRERAGR